MNKRILTMFCHDPLKRLFVQSCFSADVFRRQFLRCHKFLVLFTVESHVFLLSSLSHRPRRFGLVFSFENFGYINPKRSCDAANSCRFGTLSADHIVKRWAWHLCRFLQLRRAHAGFCHCKLQFVSVCFHHLTTFFDTFE